MYLERQRMQPLVDQITKATLGILPITLVVAGAIIQVSAALLDTNYWVSLVAVWVSAAFFTLALVLGLLFESTVNTGGEKFLAEIPLREKRLFWGTIFSFGIGLLLFLVSPLGIFFNDRPKLNMITTEEGIVLEPGETAEIGALLYGGERQTVEILATSSSDQLSAQVSPTALALSQTEVSSFVVHITADVAIVPGTYPIAIQVVSEGMAEEVVKSILVTVD